MNGVYMKLYQSAYAQALFEIAEEDGIEEQIFDELTETAAFAEQSPEFSELMSSPVFSAEERTDVIGAIFRPKAQPVFADFLCVLAQAGRGGALNGIAEEYKKLYYEKNGIAEAEVVTAEPLTADARERLKAKLSVRYGRKIILSERVDKAVIGGVCVRVGDDMIDGTVRSKLAKAAREL